MLIFQDKFDNLSTQVGNLSTQVGNLSAQIGDLSSKLSLLQHQMPHVQDSCLKVKTESDDDEKKYMVGYIFISNLYYLI